MLLILDLPRLGTKNEAYNVLALGCLGRVEHDPFPWHPWIKDFDHCMSSHPMGHFTRSHEPII